MASKYTSAPLTSTRCLLRRWVLSSVALSLHNHKTESDDETKKTPMTESFSPAPPETEALPAVPADVNCWRDGNILVLRRSALLFEFVLPGQCCAKCGKPASLPAQDRLLGWSSRKGYIETILTLSVFFLSYAILHALTALSWEWLLGLASLLAFLTAMVIGFIFDSKTKHMSFTVYIPLCARHQRFSQMWLILFWFVISIIFLILTWMEPSPTLRFALQVMFLSLLILMALLTKRFIIKNVDQEYVYIKGCGEKFLASLPEFRQKPSGE